MSVLPFLEIAAHRCLRLLYNISSPGKVGATPHAWLSAFPSHFRVLYKQRLVLPVFTYYRSRRPCVQGWCAVSPYRKLCSIE